MQLLESAEEVSDIAFGFMASKALFAALHFGVFSHLSEGPLGAEELTQRTGLHPDRLITLATALATLGLIGKDADGHFVNSPAANAFLSKGAKYDFGDYLRNQIDQQMYELLGQIDLALADKLPADSINSYSKWMSDPEQARLYSESQHAGSLGPAASLARSVALSGSRKLLDIGGGTGAFAITLCEQNPALHATVIDFPNVADLGKSYVQKAGLESRVTYQPGNLLEVEWPDKQDVVLMSYIFSSVPGEDIERLIEQACDVLEPGGRLLIHDFMVQPDRMGPRLAALWQFQHTAFNPHARSVATDWAAAAVQARGFVETTVRPMIPGMTSLVSAVRT